MEKNEQNENEKFNLLSRDLFDTRVLACITETKASLVHPQGHYCLRRKQIWLMLKTSHIMQNRRLNPREWNLKTSMAVLSDFRRWHTIWWKPWWWPQWFPENPRRSIVHKGTRCNTRDLPGRAACHLWGTSKQWRQNKQETLAKWICFKQTFLSDHDRPKTWSTLKKLDDMLKHNTVNSP